MGNEQTNTRTQHAPSLPSNARLMNTAIKQRLQKGNGKSTYNMKVVIRGDRQTGKSALFHRLEGGGFIKEHQTTEQIQCSHVLWPYKTSDEMVNLEIWDVVDKAIIPTNIADDDNGILKPSIVSKNLLPADATTIDVYKGAHAIIFMVDPTRKWTLEYVKTNITLLPNGIDCVILFGKKDLHKLWTLTQHEIQQFMSIQPKNIRSLQISLQDCYGMKELHSFFNVPFLRMKAKYLQQELERAQREYEQSKVELDIFINHQDYDQFLTRLRTLKDNKSGKMKAVSPNNVHVKQTVHSSKDLPLIQEQHLKEKAKKKEEEEKKEEAAKKQIESIDAFKPTGGLDDDFFADLGHNDQEEDDVIDDNNSECHDEEGTKINGHNKEKSPQIGFDVDDEHDGIHQNEGENGHNNGDLNGNNIEYSRMPDLKLSSNNNGKIHTLMKVQTAEIESTDSDEYDDEPLVFAAPKQIKKVKPDVIMDPIDNTEDMNSNDNDNDDNDVDKVKMIERVDDTQQKAFDAFLDDLTGNNTVSKSVSKSISEHDDGEEEEEDEIARRKRKEEKRRRRKEKKEKRKKKKKKKKHKHSDDEDNESEQNSKKKKRSKKKKKKKKKQVEKDNDLVEFESDTDDMLNLE